MQKGLKEMQNKIRWKFGEIKEKYVEMSSSEK